MRKFTFLVLLSVLIVGLSNVFGQNNNCNYALVSNGSTVSAISEGTYQGTTHYADYAIDGDLNTFWASEWDMPAWIIVDLNQTRQIDMIAIAWYYNQQEFSISLSNDGNNWTTVVPSQQSNNTPDGGNSHELYPISSTNARYIKVDITATTAPSSHIFKATIWEIEAYELSCSPTSVNTYNESNNINIYPNPVSNELFVEFKNKQNVIINIFNSLGQQIYTEKLINYQQSIDMTSLNNGIYLINIKDENGNILLSEKILKE